MPAMALDALSPLDGRYFEAASPLREYFSEYAYLRSRLEVEVRYLAALGQIGLVRPLNSAAYDHLMAFTPQDALRVKVLERTTRHDVKAIEYFLHERITAFQEDDRRDLIPFIHFGLTSEDVNNLAQALALKVSRDRVLLPSLDGLLECLRSFALRYRSTPMLARTHGQPAVPTTLGKEFALFFSRIRECRRELASHHFEGKLTGAAGNFNALSTAAPTVDWMAFSRKFVEELGLAPNLATTQILPADNWLRYFHKLHLTNSILIDLAQDVWRYISDGFLVLPAIKGEVGSSTMPQKVNPIDFENAEGNAGIANAHLAFYTAKLPVSRLQRDLSDSTVRRTFGTALGHTLLAWQNMTKGMTSLAADEARMRNDLNSHWEVISEGAQTILRATGRADAYESLADLTRGRALDQTDYLAWVDALGLDDQTRDRLSTLSPENYTGLAGQIVDEIISEKHSEVS